jgi:cell division protein FtsQ
LDRAALIEISGLEGESMLSLPVASARARILEVPQVRSVSIRRDWPQGVTIVVEERQPYAFWSVGGRDYTVDAEGVVLAAGAPSGPAPRIVEMDANRTMSPGDRVHPDALALAVRIMKESPRFLGQTVRELEYRPGIGVTAVFSGGMRVTFGDERSYEYKVAVLAKLIDQLSARGQLPRAVDLRFGERVTYE